MPHISKEKLNTKTRQKILDQLSRWATGNGLQSKKGQALFELLTPTEQLMLAKRLAVIFLLRAGNSMYYIAHNLKVSPSTVERIYFKLENNEFSELINLWEEERRREEMWEFVETLLRGGMPPLGKDRWKGVNEIIRKQKVRDKRRKQKSK